MNVLFDHSVMCRDSWIVLVYLKSVTINLNDCADIRINVSTVGYSGFRTINNQKQTNSLMMPSLTCTVECQLSREHYDIQKFLKSKIRTNFNTFINVQKINKTWEILLISWRPHLIKLICSFIFQMTTGIVVLFLAKQIGLVDFPGFSFGIFWKVCIWRLS